MNKQSHYLLLFIIGLLTLTSHGEISTSEKKDKPKGRPVKIMYYMAPKNAPSNTTIYSNNTILAETKLPKHNFSDTFTIPKGNLNLQFLPEPQTNGETTHLAAPTVNIPEAWEKILLMVYTDKANKVMPIRVKAINASDDKFGPGSIYMLNFSQVSVFGTVGDKELKLKPRSSYTLKNPINKNGAYPVKLQSIAPGDKKPRRFIKQMWSNSDTMRNVLFILPKPAPLYATYYCAPIRDF